MDMKKIFDISTKPTDMNAFFRNFIFEFEKTLLGGDKSSVIMFFEDGPRDGYSTTFKSMGGGYSTYTIKIKFALSESKIDVLLGWDFKHTGPMGGFGMGIMKKTLGVDMIDTMQNLGSGMADMVLGQYVEGAIKKALRDTREETK